MRSQSLRKSEILEHEREKLLNEKEAIVEKFLSDFIYDEEGEIIPPNKVKFYGEGAKFEGEFKNVRNTFIPLNFQRMKDREKVYIDIQTGITTLASGLVINSMGLVSIFLEMGKDMKERWKMGWNTEKECIIM